MYAKAKTALSAILILAAPTAAFAWGQGVPGERNPNPIFGPLAQTYWYEGGRNMLAERRAAMRGSARTPRAEEGRAQVRHLNPYQGRAQYYGAPVFQDPPERYPSGGYWGSPSTPSHSGASGR